MSLGGHLYCLLCFSCAIFLQVKAAQNFEDGTIELPLGVSVWMIGAASTNDDTGDVLKTTIDPSTFETTLKDILPYYQPVVSASGAECANSDCVPSKPAPSSVTFAMTYTMLSSVAPVGQPPALAALEAAFLLAYGSLIKKSPLQGGVHQVPVPAVLSLLRTLCEGYLSDTDTAKVPVEFLRASAFNVPVIVLAANDPSAPLPAHVLIGKSSGLCSNSVVGVVAFYDNTAATCDLLSMLTLNQASSSSDAGSGGGGDSNSLVSLPLSYVRHVRGHLISFAEEDELLQKELQRQATRNRATLAAAAKAAGLNAFDDAGMTVCQSSVYSMRSACASCVCRMT
jgi:hypothetical protein